MNPRRPLFFAVLLLFLAAGCNLQDPGIDASPDTGADSDVGDGDLDPDDGDLDPGDLDPGDGDLEPSECNSGEERSCPCEEDGIQFDGVETCVEDSWPGECACPTVCNEPRIGLVTEGSSCGLCNSGSFFCQDGIALCDVPVDVNPCGGCAPSSMPTCDANLVPVCDADEAVQCVPAQLRTIRVHPRLEPDRHTVHYLYIDDPDASCQGWEPAAAHETLPAAYQPVEILSFGGNRTSLELSLPPDAEGILRIVVQQDLTPNLSTSLIRGAHFACSSVNEIDFNDLPLYFHPFPFRGEASLTITPQIDETDREALFSFAQASGSGIAHLALENFSRSPGSLLTGCSSAARCPKGNFPGLFEHFQLRRDDLAWDTDPVAGWNSFYPRWRDVLEAIGPHRIAFAYDRLIDEHRQALYDFHPAWTQWAPNNLDEFNLLRLPPLTGLAFLHREFHPTFSLSDFDPDHSVDARILIRSHPLRNCPSLGGVDGYCPPPASWVDGSSSPPPLSIDVDPDLFPRGFTPQVRNPGMGPLLKHLLDEYFPAHLYPGLETDAFGDFHLSPYARLKDFFNELATCSQVHEALLSDNEDPSLEEAIDEFLDLCILAIEAPDGEDFLTQVLAALPLQHPGTVDVIADQALHCPPRFVDDPFHGLRLAGFIPQFNCQILPSTLFMAFSAAYADTFFPLEIHLE